MRHNHSTIDVTTSAKPNIASQWLVNSAMTGRLPTGAGPGSLDPGWLMAAQDSAAMFQIDPRWAALQRREAKEKSRTSVSPGATVNVPGRSRNGKTRSPGD